MSRAGFAILFSIVATAGCERAPEPVKVETRSEVAKAEPGKKKDTKGETRAVDGKAAAPRAERVPRQARDGTGG
jgi:hypothetical protein